MKTLESPFWKITVFFGGRKCTHTHLFFRSNPPSSYSLTYFKERLMTFTDTVWLHVVLTLPKTKSCLRPWGKFISRQGQRVTDVNRITAICLEVATTVGPHHAMFFAKSNSAISCQVIHKEAQGYSWTGARWYHGTQKLRPPIVTCFLWQFITQKTMTAGWWFCACQGRWGTSH